MLIKVIESHKYVVLAPPLIIVIELILSSKQSAKCISDLITRLAEHICSDKAQPQTSAVSDAFYSLEINNGLYPN